VKKTIVAIAIVAVSALVFGCGIPLLAVHPAPAAHLQPATSSFVTYNGINGSGYAPYDNTGLTVAPGDMASGDFVNAFTGINGSGFAPYDNTGVTVSPGDIQWGRPINPFAGVNGSGYSPYDNTGLTVSPSEIMREGAVNGIAGSAAPSQSTARNEGAAAAANQATQGSYVTPLGINGSGYAPFDNSGLTVPPSVIVDISTGAR